MEKSDNKAQGVAIIGMACIFPKAPDLESYWNNILDKVDAIGEPIPEWEAARYQRSGRPEHDSVYTEKGGFLGDLYRFDPTEFGIMPSSLDGGEPDQFLALKVAADALADGGYLRDDYDHAKTGIILGHSTYLHRGQANAIQHGAILDQTVELLSQLFPHMDEARQRQLRAMLKSKLPPFNPDVAPGLVPNVITGRIANRLNLMGPNYIIDAACASSSLALEAAMDELLSGRSDLMLAGGVNASLPPEVAVIFSQLGALSRQGKVRPFEAGSEGTLLGEGLGVVLLKRLDEALRDGDRIYSVVRGVGHASDGRGQGLLAPRLEGESAAIDRAYGRSGVAPAEVGLIEAHGTGIPLGDQTEIKALSQHFGSRQGALPRVALGSVKSMISHTIPAAGVAGLIKTSLALYHKIIPPTLCDTVNPELGLDQTPFYVNAELRPWLNGATTPRRAGINAFGFGGINTHVVLEEPPGEAAGPLMAARRWECELVLLAASGAEALVQQLEQLQGFLATAADVTLADVAYSALRQLGDGRYRLAIVADSLADLEKKLAQAAKRLAKGKRGQWATRTGLFYCDEPLEGDLALMFTGEGGQYQGMLADLAYHFPVVRQWLDFWEGLYQGEREFLPSDILYPPALGLDEQTRARLEARLHEMDVGSEAVFFTSQALYALLGSFGLEADAMVGHSTGESSALAASGAMAFDELAQLGEQIRKLNRIYEKIRSSEGIPTGVLLTLGALSQQEVEALRAEFGETVHLAMDNCANQVVLFGEEQTIDRLMAKAVELGGICAKLPFDRAYHTPLFKEVSDAFLDFYREIGLGAPRLPLYSCASAARFPDTQEAVQALAARQWATTVRFRETVAAMYDDGIRYFIEVGPSGNLTSFVDDVLKGKPYLALPSNVRHRSGLAQLLQLLGQLFSQGRALDLAPLFSRRKVRLLDFSSPPPAAKDRSLRLLNTLPYIRLDEAQLAELRHMLAVDEPKNAESKSAEPGLAAEPAQPVAPVATVADERDQAMLQYFGLMREFIDSQQRMLQLAEAPAASLGPWPFIDEIELEEPRRLIFRCLLDSQTQRFLRHHVLSGAVSAYHPERIGLAVAPLTVSLEIMAEAAAYLAGPERVLQAMENIQAYNWLALDDERLELTVEAVQEADGRIGVVIRQVGQSLIEAEFLMGDEKLAKVEAVAPLTGRLNGSRWRDDELYALGMFHGPIFQSIAHIRAWNREGIDADLARTTLDGFFVEGERPRFVLNPVVLDAVGQLSAYWVSEQEGTDFNCFPSSIRRIEFAETQPDEQAALVLRGRLANEEFNEAGQRRFLQWDYDCVDENRRVLFRAHGWRDRYFNVSHQFYQARKSPQNGWFGQPVTLFQERLPQLLLWWLPPFEPGFLEDAGAIFKRLLARSMLSEAEYGQWTGLTANPQRRSEWLLGRMALKEAGRYLLYNHYGELLYPADVEVGLSEHGKPFLYGEWQTQLPLPIEVSLSHSQGVSLVAARGDGRAVGVDMEFFGRVSQPQLIANAFLDEEKQTLEGLAGEAYEAQMLRIWCAKEAAAKLVGMGLHGRLKAFRVILDGKDVNSASVEYDGRRVDVLLASLDNGIIAVATED